MLVGVELGGLDRRSAGVALVSGDDDVGSRAEVPIDDELVRVNGVGAVLGGRFDRAERLHVLRGALGDLGSLGEEVDRVADRLGIGLPFADSLEGAVVLGEAGDVHEILNADLAAAQVDLGGLRLDGRGPRGHCRLRGLEERRGVVLDVLLVLALGRLLDARLEEVEAFGGRLHRVGGVEGSGAVERHIVRADLLAGECLAVVRLSDGRLEGAVDVDRGLDRNVLVRSGDLGPVVRLGGHRVDQARALGDLLGLDLRGDGGSELRVLLLGLRRAFDRGLLAENDEVLAADRLAVRRDVAAGDPGLGGGKVLDHELDRDFAWPGGLDLDVLGGLRRGSAQRLALVGLKDGRAGELEGVGVSRHPLAALGGRADVRDRALVAALGQFELRSDVVGARLLNGPCEDVLGHLHGIAELRVAVAQPALLLQLVDAVLEGSGGADDADLVGGGPHAVGRLGVRGDPGDPSEGRRVRDSVGPGSAELLVVASHEGGDSQRVHGLGFAHVRPRDRRGRGRKAVAVRCAHVLLVVGAQDDPVVSCVSGADARSV